MNKILQQSDSQQLQVLKLSEKLEDRNKKVNTLLNNAGQGFLYFNENMIIGDEYSSEVKKIFNIDVAGKNITHLLYDDSEKQVFLTVTLQDILKENEIRQEILISLLENEFYINNKFIQLEYKILDEKNFMLILTDITLQKELDKKIKDEQQILKMVVEVITDLEQFLEIKESYIQLIKSIDNYKSFNMLNDLKREIHTFKGLFAQKEMLHIVEQLHNFETFINKSIKDKSLDKDIQNITYDTMYNWLDKDIQILKDILGDNIFNKSDYISISKTRITDLQDKIKLYIQNNKLNDKDIYNIYKDTEELKYHNIKILFRPYEKLVEQLSQRLDKIVNPLILDGDDIYIGDRYKPFINSLVHIFRNSLDHGIETPEERFEKEKDEAGTIKCNFIQNNNNLIISIEDDGAGIDIEKIKKLALEKSLYTQDKLNQLSEQEILMIIFKDDFSTSESVTDISGRGIGLASVLNELNKLNGKLEINNNFGYGIAFKFTIPLR